MLMDTLSAFSANAGDDISSTGTSTNVLDVNLSESIGEELYLHIIPTTDFAGTSVTFTLETDTVAAFSSATDLVVTPALTAAQVNAGYKVRVPQGNEGYLRVTWVTVSGTAGTAQIFLSPSVQDQTQVGA